MSVVNSIGLFVLAGLAEIGGGYLMWLWLRDGRAFVLGAVGAMILMLYGVIPTLQPAHFSRVYAAYGGVFVVMAMAWGYVVDKRKPDVYDLAGAALVVAGVAVMMYWPRQTS